MYRPQTQANRTVPFQPNWLVGVGLFFFMLNITLFIMNCCLITMRFILRPGSFVNSFTDQIESLFIPAFVSPVQSTPC